MFLDHGLISRLACRLLWFIIFAIILTLAVVMYTNFDLCPIYFDIMIDLVLFYFILLTINKLTAIDHILKFKPSLLLFSRLFLFCLFFYLTLHLSSIILIVATSFKTVSVKRKELYPHIASQDEFLPLTSIPPLEVFVKQDKSKPEIEVLPSAIPIDLLSLNRYQIINSQHGLLFSYTKLETDNANTWLLSLPREIPLQTPGLDRFLPINTALRLLGSVPQAGVRGLRADGIYSCVSCYWLLRTTSFALVSYTDDDGSNVLEGETPQDKLIEVCTSVNNELSSGKTCVFDMDILLATADVQIDAHGLLYVETAASRLSIVKGRIPSLELSDRLYFLPTGDVTFKYSKNDSFYIKIAYFLVFMSLIMTVAVSIASFLFLLYDICIFTPFIIQHLPPLSEIWGVSFIISLFSSLFRLLPTIPFCTYLSSRLLSIFWCLRPHRYEYNASGPAYSTVAAAEEADINDPVDTGTKFLNTIRERTKQPLNKPRHPLHTSPSGNTLNDDPGAEAVPLSRSFFGNSDDENTDPMNRYKTLLTSVSGSSLSLPLSSSRLSAKTISGSNNASINNDSMNNGHGGLDGLGEVELVRGKRSHHSDSESEAEGLNQLDMMLKMEGDKTNVKTQGNKKLLPDSHGESNDSISDAISGVHSSLSSDAAALLNDTSKKNNTVKNATTNSVKK